MTAMAMDGTGPTERRQLAVDLEQWPFIWDSEYDAWNAENEATAQKGTEGHTAPSLSSLALATESREHDAWDLGTLGTRRLHRQAAWLRAPETPESLGPLLK